jgi:hypothetical protein
MSTPANPAIGSRLDPQRHGNVAQWATVIAAICLGLLNLGLTVWYHATSGQPQAADDHTNVLITAKLGPVTETITQLNEKMGKLEGRFDQLDSEQKKATRLQLNRLSAQIATALTSKTDIDPAIVARLGEDLPSFVKSSTPEISQAAWRVTTQLSDYRSFLNSQHGPNTADATAIKPPGVWAFEVNARALPNAPDVIIGVLFLPNEPIVAGSEAAMFVKIGEENKITSAPRLWIVEGKGAEISLDGYHVRNSIVKDAHIVYNGGPLILENVYFVNCVFDVKHTDTGSQFTQAIITSSPSSFKTAS